MIKKAVFSLLVVSVLFLPASCAPTYPREKIVDGVKKLCQKEYGENFEVKLEGVTLGVRLPLEGLFDAETGQLVATAFGKIDNLMLSIARVALSCDKSIDFFTVITYDKKVPGIEIVITRYVPDLRRFVFNDISRGEFAERMVFDKRVNPQGIVDLWLGEFTLKDIKLSEFIYEQAAGRVMNYFLYNPAIAGKFKITDSKGSLNNRVFELNVDISREGLPLTDLIHGTAWHEQVLEICLKTMARVIHAYDFKDFDRAVAHNTYDNKTLEMTKDKINYWRNRRIKLDQDK